MTLSIYISVTNNKSSFLHNNLAIFDLLSNMHVYAVHLQTKHSFTVNRYQEINTFTYQEYHVVAAESEAFELLLHSH